MKKEFVHLEWGVVKIALNSRARRIIMRAREDGIYVTAPPMATMSDVERALDRYGEKLRQLQVSTRRVIAAGYKIGDGGFRIELQEYTGTKFMWVHNGMTATLMCPENIDYQEKQDWLRKVIVNAITDYAKKVLPPRLAALAGKHNLKYTCCSVRNSHTRWGSCSGKGNISLSIYLVLLPDELIDYVLLHELCHTLEMNHSERFWARLDVLCGGDSKKIRRKLKNHIPGI